MQKKVEKTAMKRIVMARPRQNILLWSCVCTQELRKTKTYLQMTIPIERRRLVMLTKYPNGGDTRQIEEFFVLPRTMLNRMMQLLRQRMQSAMINLSMKVKVVFWNTLLRTGMLIKRISAMTMRENTFSAVKILSKLFPKLWKEIEIFANIWDKITPCSGSLESENKHHYQHCIFSLELLLASGTQKREDKDFTGVWYLDLHNFTISKTRPSSDSEAVTMYKLKGKSLIMGTGQGFK